MVTLFDMPHVRMYHAHFLTFQNSGEFICEGALSQVNSFYKSFLCLQSCSYSKIFIYDSVCIGLYASTFVLTRTRDHVKFL